MNRVFHAKTSSPAINFAIAMAVIYTLLGVTGNSLTIVGLTKDSNLRSQATTKFIISLAVSDLLFCAIMMPLNVAYFVLKREGNFNGFPIELCQFCTYFYYAASGVSLFNLLLITINRYILICKNSKYCKIYTNFNIGLMIACIWFLGCGLIFFPLVGIWGKIGRDIDKYGVKGPSCNILHDEKGHNPKMFYMVLAFFLPCVTIIFCYSAIFLKIKKLQRELCGMFANLNKKEREDDIRQIKMMLTVFLCFVFTFLPIGSFNVIDKHSEYGNSDVEILCHVLWWSSSVVNPIIYVFRNRHYRKAIFLLCGVKPSSIGFNTHSQSHTQPHAQPHEQPHELSNTQSNTQSQPKINRRKSVEEEASRFSFKTTIQT